MNLQMQLKRGLVALTVWILLGGFVLSHAGAAEEQRAAAAIHAALQTGSRCDSSLRIDLTQSVHLTMACDRSCAPVREVMHALRVPVRKTPTAACAATKTA